MLATHSHPQPGAPSREPPWQPHPPRCLQPPHALCIAFATRLLQRLHHQLAGWMVGMALELQPSATMCTTLTPAPAASTTSRIVSGLQDPSGAQAARQPSNVPKPSQGTPPPSGAAGGDAGQAAASRGPGRALRAAVAQHGFLLQPALHAWMEGRLQQQGGCMESAEGLYDRLVRLAGR